MHSILGKTQFEFIEKKSKFIGLLYHIENPDKVNQILDEVKSTYPGANHYVYAYIINQRYQKASDDGEPQRTAGYPVLDVLNKNELNDVLAIVIRYFGGIKLGSGGLIRAYSHTVAETIKKATLISKVTIYQCSLETDYDHIGDIDQYLRNHTDLKDVQYDQRINFHFNVFDKDFEQVKKHLFNINQYQDKLKVIDKKVVYAKVNR
jgi:uncharacterized YigZ family protein